MLEIINCQIEAKTWRITLPDIDVQKGELLVITGPSGIGKSTLLHWLLGNIPQHVAIKGQIILSGINITHLAIEQRRVGLLMQDVYLFPHLNVQDNICFALPKNPQLSSKKPPRSSKKQRRAAAMNMLEQINLEHLATRYPQNLSGGERSRVGLIRALANQPQVMLLDEPFAALDPSTREQMGAWAFQQLAEQNIPSVMVSHDVEDIPASAKQICLADYYQASEQK
ncbi:ATP-binding cassette domain-containing protein [Paraglaciecola sp. MB-3u-78]|uniref:ATP-binding cassette domain-containing protein n=1 Tax=Paraglaciecola sp. MB-3u-78 TaxID=2058332 RepID=UPI000C332708|nr:ATP-binding cassette domain-containing protein [Paraglaciecola sp. MB-3u-78]PKG97971.1 ABC transporter [Paraglaciecola sp. MB-3u-78]